MPIILPSRWKTRGSECSHVTSSVQAPFSSPNPQISVTTSHSSNFWMPTCWGITHILSYWTVQQSCCEEIIIPILRWRKMKLKKDEKCSHWTVINVEFIIGSDLGWGWSLCTFLFAAASLFRCTKKFIYLWICVLK